jgi:glutamyl-Q tRNA(Asp) synthetase
MQSVIGRFAPTPSGGLHLGSVCTAVASFLNARAQGGLWKIRIDDVDKPREVPGSATSILHILECLGLEWDGAVIYQSEQLENYASAIDLLTRQKLLYPCICTRKKINGKPYPGNCSHLDELPLNHNQLRVRVKDSLLSFNDIFLGKIIGDLNEEYGDFIVKRADGVFSYDISTVIDDEFMGVTEIIRGADLARLTLRRLHLQELLSLKEKTYGHISLVRDIAGEKLSKQKGAEEITIASTQKAMLGALFHLGLCPTLEISMESPKVLLNWALTKWQVLGKGNQRSLP